jgi:general secretion pathway protein G
MNLRKSNRPGHGFTLIEILIVVVILAILATIVIPQFSKASALARVSSVETTAQTLRSAVQLYYYQHNDKLPPIDRFWQLMTTQTDASGNAFVAGTSTTGPFGPYMQSIPLNAINASSTVVDAALAPGSTLTSVCGFEYDYNSGRGDGVVHGTDVDALTIVP